MATVIKAFKYYDDGINCTLHEEGEAVTGAVEEYAISQGFAEGADKAPAATYLAKHRGGGKWDVYGPDGIVESDLDKETAKAKAEELNGANQ